MGTAMVRLVPMLVRGGAFTNSAGVSAGVPHRFTDTFSRVSPRPERVMAWACSATLPVTSAHTYGIAAVASNR